MSGEVLFVQFTVSCNTIFFYFTTATTEIYTLSLHDALPILWGARYITPNGKRRVFGSWHHGTMANAHPQAMGADRKSTRLNSSHVAISYAVFCLKKKKTL